VARARRRRPPRDVRLAESIAEARVSGAGAAALPWELLLHARQRAAKTKILVHERRAESRRRGIDDLPPQVRFPVRERHRGEQAVGRLEENRILDVDGGDVGAAFAGEEARPVEARRKLRELRRRHLVIVRVRIPELDARLGGTCQRSLDREHPLRIGCGLLLAVTNQLKHPRDVIHVIRANVGVALGIVQIVIAIGKRQPALPDPRDHFGAVFGILLGAEAEDNRHTASMEPRDLRLQLRAIADRGNAPQLVGDGLISSALGGRGIHA